MDEKPEHVEPEFTAEELTDRAHRLLHAVAGARQEGRPQQARMLLDAADLRVVARARALLDAGPRYWFADVASLRGIGGADEPGALDAALAKVWKDYDAQDGVDAEG